MRNQVNDLSKRGPSKGGDHFAYEVGVWLREIDFFLTEIAYMKTRLAYVVDLISDNQQLESAESYQNHFIDLGAQFKDLREQCKQHNDTISLNSVTVHPANEKKNAANHGKLRRCMQRMEKKFVQLKNDFNKYLETVFEVKIN
jgi:hypothetical protein